MSRPLVEMADTVRCAGQAFIERSRRWIDWQHQKVLLAIVRCRTAALGGHRDRRRNAGGFAGPGADRAHDLQLRPHRRRPALRSQAR
jgi:hypothetical protein